jgi:hypothetical protein
MTSEPDVPDRNERDAAAQAAPRAAVDELEDAVVDGPTGDTPDATEGDDALTPAFELDLDPEDQGTAEAAAANPD